MTLRNELQEIRGIGEAKADQILSVVDEYGGSGVDSDAVDAAIRAAERGNEGEVIAFLESLKD